MWSMLNVLRTPGIRASAKAIGLVLVTLTIGACGTIEIQAGNRFNPALLEQSLRAGVSTQDEVQAVLGQPYGRGRALMPFHEAERTVWTYFYERGSIDMSSSQMTDRRIYLFVFMADDRLDGYMWFASEMR